MSQRLESELMAGLLMRLLHDSDNPALISAALSEQPDTEQIANHLRDHNVQMHGKLSARIGQRGAAPEAPRAKGGSKQAARSETIRNVRAMFDNGLAGK